MSDSDSETDYEAKMNAKQEARDRFIAEERARDKAELEAEGKEKFKKLCEKMAKNQAKEKEYRKQLGIQEDSSSEEENENSKPPSRRSSIHGSVGELNEPVNSDSIHPMNNIYDNYELNTNSSGYIPNVYSNGVFNSEEINGHSEMNGDGPYKSHNGWPVSGEILQLESITEVDNIVPINTPYNYQQLQLLLNAQTRENKNLKEKMDKLVEQFNSEKKELKKKLAISEGERCRYEADIKDNKIIVKLHQEKTSKMEEEIEKLETKLQEAKDKIEHMELDINTFNITNQNLERQLIVYQKGTHRKSELEELESSLAKTKTKYEHELSELRKDFEKEMKKRTSLEEKLHKSQLEKEELRCSYESKLERKNKVIDDLTSQLDEAQQERIQTRKDGGDFEITVQVLNENEELKQKTQALEQTIEGLIRDLKHYEQQEGSEGPDNCTINELHNAIQAKLSLREDNEKLSRLMKLKEEQMLQLQNQYSDNINALKKQNENLTQELEQRETNIKTIKKEKENEINRLEKLYEQTKQKMNLYEKQNETFKKEIQELKHQIDLANAVRNGEIQQHKDIAQYEDIIKNTKVKLQEKDEIIEKQKVEIIEAKNLYINVQNNIFKESEESKRRILEMAKIVREYEEKNKEFVTLEFKLQELNEENKLLKSEENYLKKKLEDYEKKILESEEFKHRILEMTKIVREYELKKKDFANLELKLQELNEENKLFKSEDNYLKKKLEDYEKKILELEELNVRRASVKSVCLKSCKTSGIGLENKMTSPVRNVLVESYTSPMKLKSNLTDAHTQTDKDNSMIIKMQMIAEYHEREIHEMRIQCDKEKQQIKQEFTQIYLQELEKFEEKHKIALENRIAQEIKEAEVAVRTLKEQLQIKTSELESFNLKYEKAKKNCYVLKDKIMKVQANRLEEWYMFRNFCATTLTDALKEQFHMDERENNRMTRHIEQRIKEFDEKIKLEERLLNCKRSI